MERKVALLLYLAAPLPQQTNKQYLFAPRTEDCKMYDE
jgi:hypothetical protein